MDAKGNLAFYESDRIGSVIGVTNAAGSQVNNFWYDPNGKLSYGQLADPSKGVPEVNWKFAGYLDDSTTAGGAGFYKVGMRYLDTFVNRWTQLDPKTRIVNPAQPAEASPYCYVGGNGCNQTDPTGAYSIGSACFEDQVSAAFLSGFSAILMMMSQVMSSGNVAITIVAAKITSLHVGLLGGVLLIVAAALLIKAAYDCAED